jgi:serine/threonine protein kinase
MGIVFEAEQESIGRKVAVKLLPRRFAKHSTRAAQFVREARIAARLQHPNIVPIFSFGEQDDNFYYVMQFIEGAGLDRLIASWKEQKGLVCVEELIAQIHPRETPVLSLRTTRRFLRSDSWPQLGKIGAQIAAALRHAHQQGTLHRDVKPGNLLIDQQGKVWITDFGLAVGREHFLDERPETVAGTVRYMAPEQFSGHGDERSDIYSLGATLYELCTLQPAFTELNQRKMMLLIRDGKFAPPRQARREIPVELERIILKAMSREPARRYRSAGELQGELLAFVNSGGVPRGLRWRRLFGH